MKIAIVIAASAVALMSGCATTPSSPTAALPGSNDNTDYARVDAINQAARAQGLLIKWVNYPEKRKAAPVGVAPAQADPAT